MRRYANTRKVTEGGYTFDSQREYQRYKELKLLQRVGVIHELVVHPRIRIEIGGIQVKYPSGRQMVYVADFRYQEHNGDIVIEDVKMESGHLTETFRIKQALVHTMGFKINIVRGRQ